MSHAGQGPYIQCVDLFKIYKIADLEVVALRGLDLSVDAGEVVAVVGASGSGKSSFLHILAGYDTPSAGGVQVGGKDLLTMKAEEVEQYRQKEVYQNGNLSSPNTGRKYRFVESMGHPIARGRRI